MNIEILKKVKLLNGWMTEAHCAKYEIDPVILEDLAREDLIVGNRHGRFTLTRKGENVINPKVKRTRKKS